MFSTAHDRDQADLAAAGVGVMKSEFSPIYRLAPGRGPELAAFEMLANVGGRRYPDAKALAAGGEPAFERELLRSHGEAILELERSHRRARSVVAVAADFMINACPDLIRPSLGAFHDVWRLCFAGAGIANRVVFELVETTTLADVEAIRSWYSSFGSATRPRLAADDVFSHEASRDQIDVVLALAHSPGLAFVKIDFKRTQAWARAAAHEDALVGRVLTLMRMFPSAEVVVEGATRDVVVVLTNRIVDDRERNPEGRSILVQGWDLPLAAHHPFAEHLVSRAPDPGYYLRDG